MTRTWNAKLNLANDGFSADFAALDGIVKTSCDSVCHHDLHRRADGNVGALIPVYLPVINDDVVFCLSHLTHYTFTL